MHGFDARWGATRAEQEHTVGAGGEGGAGAREEDEAGAARRQHGGSWQQHQWQRQRAMLRGRLSCTFPTECETASASLPSPSSTVV